MSTLPLFPTIGIPELLIILVIVLIFFGVGKIPQIGKALGEGIKGFREGTKGEGASEPDQLEMEVQHDRDQSSTSKQRTERKDDAR